MADKSEYGQEIYDLCRDLYVNKALSSNKIAQYLFDHYGVVSETDHTKPKHRKTILKWIDKADGPVEKVRTRRARIELSVAAHDLDLVRERMLELLGNDATFLELSVMEKMAVVDRFVTVRQERSRTWDVYPDKRKQIAVTTTDTGGAALKKLSRKGEEWQATWDKWVAQGKNGSPAEDAS